MGLLLLSLAGRSVVVSPNLHPVNLTHSVTAVLPMWHVQKWHLPILGPPWRHNISRFYFFTLKCSYNKQVNLVGKNRPLFIPIFERFVLLHFPFLTEKKDSYQMNNHKAFIVADRRFNLQNVWIVKIRRSPTYKQRIGEEDVAPPWETSGGGYGVTIGWKWNKICSFQLALDT